MKQQPSLFTHVFLVTTVSNKEYWTFVTKFAIKVVVIPEVFDISFLVYHVCLNSLHHYQILSIILQQRQTVYFQRCHQATGHVLTCRRHQQQTHASEWMLEAECQHTGHCLRPTSASMGLHDAGQSLSSGSSFRQTYRPQNVFKTYLLNVYQDYTTYVLFLC